LNASEHKKLIIKSKDLTNNESAIEEMVGQTPEKESESETMKEDNFVSF
jgi:hypothetical protein